MRPVCAGTILIFLLLSSLPFSSPMLLSRHTHRAASLLPPTPRSLLVRPPRPLSSALFSSSPPSSGDRKSASVSKLSSPSPPSPQTSLSTAPPKGTRDFYPPEMRLQNYLFDKFQAAARRYNYLQYDAPVLEHTELYRRKAGDEVTTQL